MVSVTISNISAVSIHKEFEHDRKEKLNISKKKEENKKGKKKEVILFRLLIKVEEYMRPLFKFYYSELLFDNPM